MEQLGLGGEGGDPQPNVSDLRASYLARSDRVREPLRLHPQQRQTGAARNSINVRRRNAQHPGQASVDHYAGQAFSCLY